MPRLLLSLLKSAAIGIIISGVILLLVPDLRKGSGLPTNFFKSPDNNPEKLSFNQAVNAAGPAIVNVYSESIESANYYRNQPVQRTNLGSGVIMDPQGYILTCLHVIENAVTTKDNIIVIGLQDGRFTEAQIVGFDTITDLAVLSISSENLPVVPQQTDVTPLVGDVVLAIGNPYNLGQTVSQGIISRVSQNQLNNYFDYIQTDAAIKEGNSGGALVDSEGTLVGITSANFTTRVRNRIENVDDVSFAIPYSLAKEVMEEIIKNGRVIRGALGFNGGHHPTNNQGIYVTGVMRGGPADQAGLRVRDLIVAVDGKPATNVRNTLEYITETRPGTKIKVDIRRENELISLDITVGELQ